jgi:hypothetical protein
MARCRSRVARHLDHVKSGITACSLLLFYTVLQKPSNQQPSAQNCDELRVPDDVGEGGAGDPEPFEVLHPGVGGDVEVVEEARQEE